MTLSASEGAELARILNAAKEVLVRNRAVFVTFRSIEQADRALALLEKQGRNPMRLDAMRLTANAGGARP